MEQNILYSMGKEGASNLVSLLSESLEPVVDMHNINDCVICSCGLGTWDLPWLQSSLYEYLHFINNDIKNSN